MSANKLEIWADGSCSGNNKTKISPGGWAAVMQYEDDNEELHEHIVVGSLENTTNNHAELMALLGGLCAIKSTARLNLKIHIYMDSSYVIDGVAMLNDMIATDFKKKDGKLYANKETWLLVYDEITRLFPRPIEFHKVVGHSGNLENERADKLAKSMVIRSLILCRTRFSGIS